MNETPWITDDYVVAEANYVDEVAAKRTLPPKIEFHDVTMRDGEGTPGVIFHKEEKIAIARKLDEIGVHRIEVGEMGVSPEDLEAIKAVANLGLKASIWCWSGPSREELDDAIASEVDGVVVGVPSGFPTLRTSGVSEQETIRRSIEAVTYVKDKGLQVTYFPYDTTRAEISFLKSLVAEVAEKACPDSIAVVDTRGVASPEAFAYLVKQVKEAAGGLPIQVHPHNDFGLAVANALASVAAGAEIVQECVAGVGERCGNCPLEPLAMALKLLYGRDPGLNLELLYELGQLVSKYSGVPIPPNQPVIGDFQFVRVTGGGIQTLKKTPTVVFPYRPELVGRHWEVWLGKVSGAAAIAYKLEQLGLDASGDQVGEILEVVKDKAITEKRCVTDEEFTHIVKQVTGS